MVFYDLPHACISPTHISLDATFSIRCPSREQKIPLLLSVFSTFRIGGHQICEDAGIAFFKPGLPTKFPKQKFICEISHFVTLHPTSNLLCAEIAARPILVYLYIFSITVVTFQFFSNVCLLNQVSLYLP